MAGISWQFPRSSESGPDAEIPDARSRVCTDIDQAIARIPALAVDVRIETRVARDREQVLARDVYPGRGGPAEQHASRQVIAEREGLESEIRSVFYERAVERARAVAIGSRHHGVGVRRVPVIQHAGALVRLHDVEAAVRVSRVDHLVSIHKVEQRVEREPAIGEGVAATPVELRLAVAEDSAIGRSDLAVPIQVGDFVLARRAGGLVREVARGARVALLPQAGGLVAVG